VTGRRRRAARTIGAREAGAIAGNLGRELRRTRLRRRLTQSQLADRVDVSQAEISALEAGRGARTPIETWVALGIALDRAIAIGFSRDVAEPLSDAGHLAAQELLIRLARAAGWRVAFEAPSDPRAPGHSTDVELSRSDRGIVLVEIWNRLDDLGAAARSSDRKEGDVRARRRSAIGSCWLLVDTAANRAIVRRFPAILRARFPAASSRWVDTLSTGTIPPVAPGVAWIDVKAGRLRPLRLAPRRA
jgi:transcriptional regulator with XRE-family HTH domain